VTREIVASKKQDWGTPRWLFNVLHAEYGFTIDLCAADYNACLPRRFGPGSELGEDGLAQPWAGERGFGNPPYEDIGSWMHKALASCAEGAFSVWLVPANTDTKWFHQYACFGQVDFFKGRLSFEDLTPPEMELERVFALWQKKPAHNLTRRMAALVNELKGTAVSDHPLVEEARLRVRCSIPDFENVETRKPGPGFPSMLVTFDPYAPAGPHPFRRRSAKTGELL
jgi:phage N-6-adenine-methyltransferase